jgi:hypothetical protein
MTCSDCKHGYTPTYDLRRKGWLFCANKSSKYHIRREEGTLVYVQKSFKCPLSEDK